MKKEKQPESPRIFRKARRHIILEAARMLCRRVGYDAMTMESIAKEASVTKPTLYAYFPNKEELAVEAFVDALHLQCDYLKEQVRVVPREEQLPYVLDLILKTKFDPEQVALFYPGPPIATNARVQAEFHELASYFVSLLKFAQGRGLADPRLQPEATVHAYFAILMNPDLERRVRSGELPADETIRTLHLLLTNGLKID